MGCDDGDINRVNGCLIWYIFLSDFVDLGVDSFVLLGNVLFVCTLYFMLSSLLLSVEEEESSSNAIISTFSEFNIGLLMLMDNDADADDPVLRSPLSLSSELSELLKSAHLGGLILTGDQPICVDLLSCLVVS